MENGREKSDMVEVFHDTESLRLAFETIKKRSANKADVTKLALSGLPLESCREILDLGCAFGFFTKATQSRVHKDARVTGIDCCHGYEGMYLKTCVEAGLEGNFDASGITILNAYDEKQYDLILCSYALYFFPEMIPHISRILKSKGIFVAITHASSHMQELTSSIKAYYRDHHIDCDPLLPVEKLMAGFSDENGYQLLSPWFAGIRQIRFENALEFKPENLEEFLDYFRYKRSFFFSRANASDQRLVDSVEAHLLKTVMRNEVIRINKDDTIFICTEPLPGTGLS